MSVQRDGYFRRAALVSRTVEIVLLSSCRSCGGIRLLLQVEQDEEVETRLLIHSQDISLV